MMKHSLPAPAGNENSSDNLCYSAKNKMKSINKIFLTVSGIAAIVLLIGIIMQNENIYKPSALATAISLAIGLGAVKSLKGYQYTAWIIAAVVAVGANR